MRNVPLSEKVSARLLLTAARAPLALTANEAAAELELDMRLERVSEHRAASHAAAFGSVGAAETRPAVRQMESGGGAALR